MSKKLSEADEARYSSMSGWAENLDTLPDEANVTTGEETEPGRGYLENLLGSSAAVDRAMGRPSVDGTMRPGKSPVRQVRLSRELDTLLAERAMQEHRKPSEVMREALDLYLRKAS
jgi:hypothetical protein